MSAFVNVDPYQLASDLHKTANDLVSDVTSLTVTDLSEILRDSAEFITMYADEFNSYVTKTRITLNIGHETIDLTEELLPMLSSALLQDYVRHAIRNQMMTAPLPDFSEHDHHH